MTARELVVTYLATLAAIVVVVAGLAALVAGLPSIAGAVGGAVGGVTDAGGAFLDGLTGGQAADLSGDSGTDDGGDGDADGGDDGEAEGDTGGAQDGGDTGGKDADEGGTDAEESGPDDGGADGSGAADGADDGDGGGDTSGDGTASEETTDDGADDGTETAGAVVDDGGDSDDEDVEHERPDVDAIQDALVEAINDYRGANYVPKLDSIYMDELWTIADEHTRDMVEHGYVGTTAPDGETAVDRFERHDPGCDRVGDYEDALALAVRLNYSTVVSDPTHDDTAVLVERMMAEWRGDAGLVDDDYDDVGVSVRHANTSDALYGAVAAC